MHFRSLSALTETQNTSMTISRLLIISRPLAWVIAPAIWFAGVVHAGQAIQILPAVIFVGALTFPTCLGTSQIILALLF